MFYFVRVKIDTQKLLDYGKQLQQGTLTSHPNLTYCLQEDPSIGLNIWEAKSREEFDQLFSQHKPFYSDVMEITPVISAMEAQQVLFSQLTKEKQS